jgi:hypothetical protein
VSFLDKSGASGENRVLASFRSEFALEIRSVPRRQPGLAITLDTTNFPLALR